MMSMFERPPEETGREGCDRTVVQCVMVDQPVELTPVSSLGTVTVSCQGLPVCSCKSDEEGTRCSLLITQKVCISMPIRFGVEFSAADASISCEGDCPCPGKG